GKILLLRIAADIVERQHRNRSALGPCEGRRGEPSTPGRCTLCSYCRRLFSNRRAGCPDGADEPETVLVERADNFLIGAAIADGPPGGADAGTQGRIRNSATFPHRLNQLVLADDPIVVANEVDEQVENLRLNRHAVSFSPQLLPRDIDFKSGKPKIQGIPRMACTPQHASTYHRESIASVTSITMLAAFFSH